MPTFPSPPPGLGYPPGFGISSIPIDRLWPQGPAAPSAAPHPRPPTAGRYGMDHSHLMATHHAHAKICGLKARVSYLEDLVATMRVQMHATIAENQSLQDVAARAVRASILAEGERRARVAVVEQNKILSGMVKDLEEELRPKEKEQMTRGGDDWDDWALGLDLGFDIVGRPGDGEEDKESVMMESVMVEENGEES